MSNIVTAAVQRRLATEWLSLAGHSEYLANNAELSDETRDAHRRDAETYRKTAARQLRRIPVEVRK